MAAAAPDPLDVLRQYLTICGFDTDERKNRFITGQGFTGIDDFKNLEVKDAKSLVKSHNDTNTQRNLKLGFMIQRNIEGLIWYVRDRKRRQMNLDVTQFTAAALTTAIEQLQVDRTMADLSQKPPDLPTIDTGIGYYDWDKRMVNHFQQIRGVRGLALDYVIRRDKPLGWNPATDAANEHERLMYMVALTGVAYDQDNKTVFQHIKDCTLGEPAFEWIRQFENSNDGRAAVKALRDHFEGTSQVDKRVMLSEGVISLGPEGVFYKNEYIYSFEKYITKLRQAYTILGQHRQLVSPTTMVKRLYDGVRVQNNKIIDIAKENMLDLHRHDFEGAVAYLSSKVTQAFPPKEIDKKRGRSESRYRKISESKSSRTQNGRGGRDGRGGRGGGGRGRSEKIEFNGVNCSDVTREFSEQEWDKIGFHGRMYVNREREYNNRGRGGGRGGRGGGRGGRGGRGGDRSQQGGGGRTVQKVDAEEVGSTSQVQEETPDQSNNAKGGRAGRGFGRGMYGGNK